MRYLFHNIYGDADELIATAPSDVTCIPFGWDEQTERTRNEIIAFLGLPHISALPSVVFWFPEKTYSDPVTNGASRTFPAHWQELPITNLPKPWSWDTIDTAIDEWIAR